MSRRALTLLELLLALSLLLALGALALPVAMDSLRERAFEASSDIIGNQLLLARAHAGASGRPVELRYEPVPPRVEARYFRAEMLRERPQKGDAREPSDKESVAIVEGWAENLLPQGLWIAGQPPGAQPEAEPRPLRLALFMPDGSALMCRPIWLGDEHGRQAKLVINPWTGLSSIERLPAGGQEKAQPTVESRGDGEPARDAALADEPGPGENGSQEGDQP